MSVRVLPAVVAILFAVLLAVVLFVPFVAREHRRYGELRAGTVVVRFAALLYLLGLVAFVLVPLPPVAPGFCETFSGMTPQWQPFAGFDQIARPHTWHELTNVLADPTIQQFGFNVLLFVPLGTFVRHLRGRGMTAALLTGFGVSMLIELTQLTGIWFLYPCPYRLFDVDDLIANSAGALVGGMLAPLLRLLPGQRSGIEATQPRPVTATRRLLGMGCDLLLLWWLGTSTYRATDYLLRRGEVAIGNAAWIESGALWFGPAVLLLLVSLIGQGSSLGQHAVLLRSVDARGSRSSPWRTGLHWLAGLGGFALAQGIVHVLLPALGALLAVGWLTITLFSVLRSRGHRGIAGRFAGLDVVDVRTLRPAPERTPSTIDS
ncbi:VanZ family protein [Parasphingorhabdus pacifica]